MCVTPVILEGIGPVACRRCWQCKSNRINDWIGRCVAEQRTAKHTLFGTLTYGADDLYASVEDNLDAKMLTRSHIATWLKRLRTAMGGSRVRFFITGEYGSRKGRAHWHVLLFCEQLPPNLRFGERYIHWAKEPALRPGRQTKAKSRGRKLWDHGWSYWEEATPGGAAYCCKYLLKDGDVEQNEVMLSTMPPLGHDYFVGLAAQHVNMRLSPQSLLYSFGDILGSDGKPRRYMLRGRAAYNYLNAFVDLWRAEHGNDNWPWSRLVDAHMEQRRKSDLRKASLPDWTDERLAERTYLETLERRGQWHLSGTAIAERRKALDGYRRTYRESTRGAGE